MSGVRTSSSLQAFAGIGFRDGGGAPRSAKQGFVRTSAGLKQFFSSAPAVSVTPSYVSGSGNSKNPITVSTGTAIVTAPAGSTFAWASPDAGWTAASPTSASTVFRKNNVAAGADQDTTFTCTVTSGGTTTRVTVEAEVFNYYGGLD